MKKKAPHLLLTIDLGASGTKIVASVVGQPDYKALLMTPHCTEFDDRQSLTPESNFDEHNAWIKIAGVCYAVGNLALTQHNATNKLKPAKFTVAVPKICAAIGVTAQKFNLPDKFDISVIFVLPPSEWEQRMIVTERLFAVKDFYAPCGKIKPNFLNISCRPEGLGILLGQNVDLKEIVEPVTVIMLGYRNASILSSFNGVVSKPTTSDLGFSKLLKSVASKTGYQIDDLIVPIFELKRYRQNTALNYMLRCTGADRKYELNNLIESIASAEKEYWRKLVDWLDEHMPDRSAFICLAGGTSEYFSDEIEEYAKTKMDFHENRLRWNTQVCPIQNIRFGDIYVLWNELKNQYQPTTDKNIIPNS